MTDEPFSFEKQQDPYLWAKRKALELFTEIRELLGDEKARHIFSLYGAPLSDSRLNEIDNIGDIDRLDVEFGGNVNAFARRLAEEKFVNPTPQEVDTVRRQLRRLNATRKKNPFWPQSEG